MSRYTFEQGDDTWHLGYDKAQATFFALHESDVTEEVVDVAGTDWGQVSSVDELERAMPDSVRIPDEVRAALVADAPADHAADLAAARARFEATQRAVMMAMADRAPRAGTGHASTSASVREPSARSQSAAHGVDRE